MTYDLVVIGAGIGGLNALYAAVQYLPKSAKVLLLDQKQAAGGMWNTVYDYVRLHQPHPMFTVGDMKWDWNKPKDYLATGAEVQAHLASSLRVSGANVHLETIFGQTAGACEEIRTAQGWRAQIVFHPNDEPHDTRTITARRAIYAPGINYRQTLPLPLTSKSARSIAPSQLLPTLDANPQSPVVVVGGGKTGMDTCLAALKHTPARQVSLVNGRGTHFVNRDAYFPNGLARWTSGVIPSRMLRDLATGFDGANEQRVISKLRRKYSTNPQAPDGVFLYGIQSEEEHRAVSRDLHSVFSGYLDDVVDLANGPQITFRDGRTHTIAPNSIVVNCTGSFFHKGDMTPYAPCLSRHDTILSITPRDNFHFLSSVAGFFLTHLLYRNQLRNKGFATFDHESLFRADRNAWFAASAVQAYMNQLIIMRCLPMRLLDACHLDFDRWYPLHRRAAAVFRMAATADRDITQCRRALAHVTSRFDVASEQY